MTDFGKHDSPSRPPAGGFPPPSTQPQGGQTPGGQAPGGYPPTSPPPTYQSPGGASAYPPPGFAPPGAYAYPPAGGAYPPAPPPPPGFGGGAPPGYVFDPQSGLSIPAGTELATVGRRIGAFFLGLVLAVVTLGIGYIVWGLILWNQGTSPALRVLGMKCYRPSDGRVATFGTMALRNIVGRIAESVIGIISALVSFVLFAATDKRQSLHDLIGSTVVLYDPQKVLDQPKG